MQEKTSFWQRYGLMILTIILYGLDLGVILFVSQRLYKNIVEVTTFAALPPVFFVLWLGKGWKRKLPSGLAENRSVFMDYDDHFIHRWTKRLAGHALFFGMELRAYDGFGLFPLS